MKKINVKSFIKLASLEDIDQFQKKYSIELPSDFKSFLLQSNPLSIEEKWFLGDKRNFKIHGFYPLIDDLEHESNLFNVYEDLKDFFEDRYLPFAYDEGGWQYVISLEESDFGSVYFCRMDEDLEDGLYLMTESFSNFLARLELNE